MLISNVACKLIVRHLEGHLRNTVRFFLAFVDNGAVVKHQCSNALRLAVNVHRNLPRTAHTHTQHVVSQLPDQSSEMSTQRGAAAPFSTTSKHRPPKLANSNFKSTEKMVLYGRLTECTYFLCWQSNLLLLFKWITIF